LFRLKHIRKHIKARQLFHLIISNEIPRSPSDQVLFNTYETDPDLYNVLLIMQNHESQREPLLEVLQDNFGEITRLIDRKKRFLNINQRLLNGKQKQQTDAEIRESFKIKALGWTNIDEAFLKMKRAQWTKYFSEKKMSPIVRKLARIRLQKLECLAEKAMDQRRQKILQTQKNRQGMKAIISLYKAPRLTHRLRQAMGLIDELNDCCKLVKKNKPIKEKPIEEKQHPLTDAVMESVSWTSCCSECRQMNDIPHDTALDRFHRTHEQIIKTANYCN
ncbi:hypothetical protein KR044_009879, partial [Drosophila immigrans]